MARILMKGNEAMAEAAIQAGCQAFFGYPITPQSEIPEYFARELPPRGGLFLQAESEMAAMNMVMGASAAGGRVMTSTSGPGYCLKLEALAAMALTRLPAVVVVVMRSGPRLRHHEGGPGGLPYDRQRRLQGGDICPIRRTGGRGHGLRGL